MSQLLTLSVVCAACGGAVTLETSGPAAHDSRTHTDTTRPADTPQSWSCPHCKIPNIGALPGKLSWVRKGHGDPMTNERANVYERELDKFLDDLDYRAELAKLRERDAEFHADLTTLGLTTEDRLIAWLRTVKPTAGGVDPSHSPEQFVRDFVRELVRQKAGKQS